MKYNATPQAPIHSGFGPHTTASEVLRGRDLSGAIAIVTGGYSGIGLETTRALAEAGATVIAPARTPEKARASIAGIRGVELEEMDLIDPASIAVALDKRGQADGAIAQDPAEEEENARVRGGHIAGLRPA